MNGCSDLSCSVTALHTNRLAYIMIDDSLTQTIDKTIFVSWKSRLFFKNSLFIENVNVKMHLCALPLSTRGGWRLHRSSLVSFEDLPQCYCQEAFEVFKSAKHG